MRRRLPWVVGVLVALVVPATATAHVERPSTWPTYPGSVPQFRTTGKSIVVCQPDSAARIAKLPSRKMRIGNGRLVKRCSTHEIQTAVDRASNGTRILVLPGVYTEPTSRAKPLNDPRCQSMMVDTAEGSQAPSYEHQRTCPHDRNLIAIVGDSDGDRRCDDKCNLQITGTAREQDVLIQGDRRRQNVIRADRADGIYLGNFTLEYSDFNDVYVLETNGFHVSNLRTRYSREYGVLSFASEAGLYENIDAYGNGDSGVYPGSGPQGLASEQTCQTTGIEIRHVDSHDNNMGYSGTAGDSVYIHDNLFRDNAAGMATDSFAAGHPGMPQHCGRYIHNAFYSNNWNVFTPENQKYCEQDPLKRDPKHVCSAFQVPVGTGMLIAGGNKDEVRDNWSWDNWRQGFQLFWVPAPARGETDPAKFADTSYDNTYAGNHMGIVMPKGEIRAGVSLHPIEAVLGTAAARRPARRAPARRRQVKHRRIAFAGADVGPSSPNGVDFWWDEEGTGNCWQDNISESGPGNGPVSDPATLPGCPGATTFTFGRLDKLARQAPCATWDPQTNQFPPGCDWFTTPPKPTRNRASSGLPLPAPGLPTAIAAAAARAGETLRFGSVGAGAVRWQGAPRLLTVPLLPRDRIVTGTITNASAHAVTLLTSRIRVVSGGGALRYDAIFLNHPMHRLWPFNGRRTVRPVKEQIRTGTRLRLAPGASAPLTLAWHSASDTWPARAQVGAGWLPLR